MGHVHQAVLLAASGKRQAVSLVVDDTGVSLFLPPAQAKGSSKLLEKFHYSHIVKWVPANARLRNKGPSSCLDLQFHTTEGLKDLRMQLKDGHEVEQCIFEMHTCASSLAWRTQSRPGSPRTPNEFARTPMSATPSGSQMGPFAQFRPLDSFQDNRPSVIKTSASQQSEDPGAALRRTPGTGPPGSSPPLVGTASPKSALLDSAPAPPWLVEQRYMSPLVAAYDARVAQLEGALQERQGEMDALAAQVHEVVTENEELQKQLRDAMELVALKAAAQQEQRPTGAAGEAGPEAHERIALLLKENNLLTAQNAELDAELTRLHRAQDEAARRGSQLNRDVADLAAQLSAKDGQVDSLTRRLDEAREQVERLQAAAAGPRGDAALSASDSKALERELRVLQEKFDALAADRNGLQRGRTADESAIAALQMEADGAREEAAALRKETHMLRKQVGELRASLQSSTTRLREYQQKDVEVYTRIREAMEIAEQNKLAHEASTSRERELQGQVAALRERLASRASEGPSGRDADEGDTAWGSRRLRRDLEHANRAVSDLEDEVVELKSALARAEREKRSLKEERDAQGASARPGGNSDALSALQRALDAQQERDLLSQQLSSLQRSVQRSRNEEDVRRHQLEAELEEARNQLAQLQVAASMAKSDAAGFLRQLEQTKRLLSAVKASKQRSEEEMRAHIAAVRSERDSEVKILASKLEDAINSYTRSVSEAERMLAAKENILRKYKSEAQSMASKLESEQERSAAIALRFREMQQHAQTAAVENEALEGELQAVLRSADEGAAAQTRAAAALVDATVSRRAYDELARRLREAEMEKEKAQLDRDRVMRTSDLAVLRPVVAA